MKASRSGTVSVVIVFMLTPLTGNELKAQIADVNGAVELLDPAPVDARWGVLEGDTILFVFDEKKNVRLGSNLRIDTTTGDAIQSGILPAGTVVNSHLIHADPLGNAPNMLSGPATISFDSEILGFYFDTVSLVQTDELLGLPGTQYEKFYQFRGAGGFPNFDTVSIVKKNTLSVSLTAVLAGAMDEIRIITQGTSTPADLSFLRGDCNGDGELDVTDPIANLTFQFVGTFDPPCHDALDFDDSGELDVTDPIANLTHQFVGGPPPAAPGKKICGVDPTDDEIGCDTFAQCP